MIARSRGLENNQPLIMLCSQKHHAGRPEGRPGAIAEETNRSLFGVFVRDLRDRNRLTVRELSTRGEAGMGAGAVEVSFHARDPAKASRRALRGGDTVVARGSGGVRVHVV